MKSADLEATSVRISEPHFCRCESGPERTVEHIAKVLAAGRFAAYLLLALLATSCGSGSASPPPPSAGPPPFPLVLVSDVGLPGAATRFDYQEIDVANGHLVIAHMGDDSVVIVQLSDGSTVKVLPSIPTPRGVAVADDVGRIFVTSSGTLNQLVIIDSTALTEIARVPTGNSPDGVGWDSVHQTVGVSDQGDGAISLIAGSGSGVRTAVPLGIETGNVVFDATRDRFWITVVNASPPDQLVAVDPVTASVITRIDLPGCGGAHGLRLHPNGQSALVACEVNSVLVRVDLATPTNIVTAPVGNAPDVLSIDSVHDWLYVAAESGDLTVFDLRKPGLVNVDSEHVDNTAHTVAVDAATHRVFFPLEAGSQGTPVLRIMRPAAN